MIAILSYPLAVLLCFGAMICWGSWANTLKLCQPGWRFQLYYWDYTLGMLIVAVIAAFTLGSWGHVGSGFLANMRQANVTCLLEVFCSGVLFNLSNVLLTAAVEISGMAMAFPIGVGLALSLGVLTGYIADAKGDPYWLGVGVLCILLAIVLDAVAYGRLGSKTAHTPKKGIVVALISGVVMGLYYPLMAKAMSPDLLHIVPGTLTPYSGVFVFSVGIVVSTFVWNGLLMWRPLLGEPIPVQHYWTLGTSRCHALGLLGGLVTGLGLLFLVISSVTAGFAISYGLAQGATMVAALWGVFFWREFKHAPKGTNRILALMFMFYVIGLCAIVAAKLV